MRVPVVVVAVAVVVLNAAVIVVLAVGLLRVRRHHTAYCGLPSRFGYVCTLDPEHGGVHVAVDDDEGDVCDSWFTTETRQRRDTTT